MIDKHHGWNISFKPLIQGFILSLILAIASYRIIAYHHLTKGVLVVTILALAIIQAILQMVFFLHIGLESKPRWNLAMFLFMILITVILVGGSMWIMHNLNYNVMMKG
ncbi:MAG: cytochrome o ubiquinol oxidase subunit IV [Chlamydiia bacterium]|nr:cytochrome o ubiquinol oxidase subunit IV [Chlamydiia bacterium]